VSKHTDDFSFPPSSAPRDSKADAKGAASSRKDATPPAAPPASSAPVQPLDDQPLELSLEDTAAQLRRGLQPPTGHPVTGGYNPYDVAPGKLGARPDRGARPDAPKPERKRTDLRKLSEWIQLQRRVQTLKNDDEPGSASGSGSASD